MTRKCSASLYYSESFQDQSGFSELERDTYFGIDYFLFHLNIFFKLPYAQVLLFSYMHAYHFYTCKLYKSPHLEEEAQKRFSKGTKMTTFGAFYFLK